MSAVLEKPRHKITLADYHRMIDAGAFHEDDRLELIDGEICDMAPIGSRHAAMVSKLTRMLVQASGKAAIVQVQNPVSLPPDSEPEPDLMLLKPRDDFYAEAHPTAADVLLVIEVSDSSVRYDREVKVPLYAAHGMGEIWLIDLEARCVEVHRRPQSAHRTYGVIERHYEGALAPAALPQVALDATALFG